MEDDYAASYYGPCVVIREDEIRHLGALLHMLPRPWSIPLRERIKAAIEMKGD